MIDFSLKKANILIVDDQEANIDVLEGFLEMQGYLHIKTTTDPRQVVTLLETFQPDVILLDLSMPYMNGFEVMEELKKILPDHILLPILVLTADITSEAKIRALSGGASDFLTKPFDLLEVGLRIKNLLYSSYLQQQLQNQNKILDEKVRERTLELLKKNVELNEAKEKAEASDRLKTAFINNISHEIRTPLNGILGFGQILTDPNLGEPEKAEYLAILNESSERLINTVTKIMEISMISSGNQEVYKKQIFPEIVVSEVFKQFFSLCEAKNLQLSLAIPASDQTPFFYSDQELLGKILRHLMDNAVKFTREGFITMGYTFDEKELTFFVKDTGKGISLEGKQLIFKNFMQEDNSYTRSFEGCGLGLSISQGLVDLLGGRLWVESESGKGSTFFFTLPLAERKIEILDILMEEILDNKEKTILVAEDDDINFSYLNILLQNSMTRIIHARDGYEAVRLCREHPEINAVLIDLKMPVLDGIEAARQIKNLRKDLPVLAVTAYSGSEDRQLAMESGCDEFITKPVKKDLLLDKLAEHGVILLGRS
jgi:two-component system sensor histidine kinase/response regulator